MSRLSSALQPPQRRDDDERVLPLINVVFLLLIFFMVTGQLSATDAFRVEPARSTSETAPRGNDALVLIGTDDRLALNGESISAADLEAALAKRSHPDEPLRVRVKADARVSANRVVGVLERLRAAGVEKLHLLTVPRQR